MDEVAAPIGWIALVGAIGGALNACLSDNVFLVPATVAVRVRSRILCPGLVLNAIVGAASSAAAWRTLGGGTCVLSTRSMPNLVMTIVAALLLGAVVARWMTNEVDKRLLRAAAGRAALAPAAHPDTVSAMEAASPLGVFEAASRLAPQHHRARGASNEIR